MQDAALETDRFESNIAMSNPLCNFQVQLIAIV